jgi:threonine dehydratase
MNLPIEYSDIEAASQRLAGIAVNTPVLSSPEIDAQTGAQVFFKAENLQHTGAFKFRGAYNSLARFDAAQRRAGVITYSSGNHAQAIARSAKLLGMPAVIVMPQDAPSIKLAATRSHGAEVVMYDRYREDREAIGRRIAAERGMTLIPPYDHPDVMAGQGTAARELFDAVGKLDTLVVCLGGGGLISGCAVAARALAPRCRVVGVEPSAGNDVQQSIAAGKRIRIDVPNTIADGAQTTSPGELTFAVIQACVDEVVTVSDDALVRTLQRLAAQLKVVVEPTGCLAAAALLEGLLKVEGQRVGVILSGGNADPVRFGQYLAQGLQ